MENEYNPIRSVDGKQLRRPTTYEITEADISASDAGRTEAGFMEKMRIGTEIKIAVSWEEVRYDDCQAILKAFEPEYINVTFLNARGGFSTREFYVGDRSISLKNPKVKKWSNLSFNLITRGMI